MVEWAVNLSDTSQQWKLTQVEDTGCVMDTTKTYQFRNANSNLYMEVVNGKAEDGSNVQQWGADQPAAHNSWTLKEFGGGYYYILSALADGKTYYLNSVGEADGSNIEIRTNNKSSSHLFKFVKNPDGTYTILTRTSKDQAAVEVANAEKSSGANVQQWTVNGNACQKWNAVAFTTTTTTTTTTKATTTTAKTTTTTTKITSATSVSSTTVSGTTTAITEEPPAISGDINADGKANLADVVLLQKWLLGIPETKPADWRAGDLYADGVLNGFDLCLLRHTVTSSGNI
ncbi:RICIN domain-containing protein [Ruminococcus sp.]|uniref:RICIN domain-containing protein n=1 Tax=Ruminococcus sp. TaxID=41978 RepID=UPI0039962EF7